MKAIKESSRKRCRPLRIENDNTLWFVSSRTIEERFWLHPILTSGLHPPNRKARRLLKKFEKHADKRLETLVKKANTMRGPFQPKLTVEDARRISRGLVGSALARAQNKYKTKIFSLVVMSNHVHLIVQTKNKNLSKFMGYVKARIAEGINLLTGKRGPLWSRRYDAQNILDDDASCDKLVYNLDNPFNALLVDRKENWPGLNLAYGMGDCDDIEFEYLDRTAWHKAGRPDELSKFFRKVTLRLSPIPLLKGKDRKGIKSSVNAWRRQNAPGIEREHGPLGLEKVIQTGFETRPKNPKRSRRPYAFGSKEKLVEYFHGVSRIYETYDDRSKRFLSGHRNVVFPEGTYPPPIMCAA